ncbi:hypothetical protein LPJ66_004953 [Kickxella alabastrina]|uniref:Uncharacterized protein n=1 Tax=Kickxella alabastrina TaxID=61397 RepID=A0ACC1IK85_9FUNG|nr:hypothetical protein LPJ66_004953 [Kickxella alabastrina]
MTNTKTDTEQFFRAMRLHNEEMNMERNIGDMLPMLLPNDKDDRNSQFKVGQWVDNVKSILTNKCVETKLWVCIACRKIPIEKRVEFKEWATKNGRRNEDMDALRDFLLESYVGAATQLDVWHRFHALKASTNLAELDQYVNQFKTYVILLRMKLEDEYMALFFSDKLPWMYQPISLANGAHYQNCMLTCTVPIHFTNDLVIPVKCLVLPVSTDIILSNDWLRQHDGIIACKNDKLDITYTNRCWTLTGLHAPADDLSVPMTISTLHTAHTNDEIEGWGWLKLSFPNDTSTTLLQVTAISATNKNHLKWLSEKYLAV